MEILKIENLFAACAVCAGFLPLVFAAFDWYTKPKKPKK